MSYPKITLKKQFFLDNFLENIDGPKVKKTKVVQGNMVKLLAKSYQNPKLVNKVIVQLMKNLKSLYFHCDVTDDVSTFTHDT